MPNYILARKEKILKSNYTEVGNFAKISKGIASGFSTSQYLVIPESMDVTSNKTWEIHTKFVYGGASEQANLFAGQGNQYIIFYTGSNNNLVFNIGNGSEWVSGDVVSSTTLTTGSTYYYKLVYNGSSITQYLSKDGVSWSSEGSYNGSVNIPVFTMRIGIGRGTAWPSTSSIDLSQSYININGERWWSGDRYNKVGSWVDDYEASGFSASNYLSFGSILRPANNPWEIVFKITTGTNVTSWQILFSFQKGATSSTRYGTRIFIMPSGHFAFSVSYNGTAWDIGEHTGTEGTYSVQANTDYWLKLEYTGTQYVLYYSLNGIDYIMNSSVTSSTPMYNENQSSYIGTWLGGTGGMLDIFTGSVDLAQSHIKINNELWWTGTKLVPENKYYVFRRKRSGGESTYVIKKLEETKIYMKYVYQNWVQPVLTSDTSSSKMSLSATSTYNTTYAMWKAFDNSSSTAWLSADGTGSGSLRVKFPTNLFISKIAVTGWSNPNGATKTVTIYKDTTNINVIGAAHTFNGSGTYTWNFSNPVETNALSFHAVGTGKWGCIGEIKITAQERITTVGTPDDYDYIVTV